METIQCRLDEMKSRVCKFLVYMLFVVGGGGVVLVVVLIQQQQQQQQQEKQSLVPITTI